MGQVAERLVEANRTLPEGYHVQHCTFTADFKRYTSRPFRLYATGIFLGAFSSVDAAVKAAHRNYAGEA
jgi:hypothetical protein